MNEMPVLEKQKSQLGQASVEYVLLLAIAVALILGLANQLIKPFGNWMQDYMGQYLECLIDMGELPSIGGSSASGECNSKFSSFSVTQGRPPLAKEGGGPKSRDSKKNERRDPRASGDSQANSGETISGGRGGSSGQASRRGFPIGAQGGADSPGSGMPEGTIIEKSPDSGFFKSRNSGNGGSMVTSGPLRGQNSQLIPMSETQRARLRKGTPSTVKELALEDESKSGKKLVIKPVERKIAAETEDAPWSFSQYIKYAVILAIIIAIVLFIGGQIAQISKSMEK